ncbi:MAG: hypothetical protein KGQ59_06120 [Bdellovibrionales bacterium]|nr:hypothetical protein [Bdellovibrionales bacterium]
MSSVARMVLISVFLVGGSLPLKVSAHEGHHDEVSHQTHEKHPHVHTLTCGHQYKSHGDHIDFLHSGHYHKDHEKHYDECPGPEKKKKKGASVSSSVQKDKKQ